jgi:hypothetical protein
MTTVCPYEYEYDTVNCSVAEPEPQCNAAPASNLLFNIDGLSKNVTNYASFLIFVIDFAPFSIRRKHYLYIVIMLNFGCFKRVGLL